MKTIWHWFRRDEQWILVALLMVLAFFGAYGLAKWQSTPPLPPVFEDAPTVASERTPNSTPGPALSSTPAPASGPVLVHVAGEVHKPGVVELPANARVVDAVRQAGGVTKDGDANTLNLAARVEDGQQIIVAKRGAAESASISSPPASAPSGATAPASRPQLSGPINVNTAGMEQLVLLPGIGPVMAQRIIDYRQQNGAFRSLADLDKVSGIGPKTLENIGPHVTF